MRAASSPTLFATASGICGLAAGPAARFPRAALRVRPLSPVRRTPAGVRHARLGSDTPAKWRFASPPATARTAAAFGRALAPRYGSDLLALELRLTLQSGGAVFSAARVDEVFLALPGEVPPRLYPPLACSHCEREPYGEVGSRRRMQSCWFAVATVTIDGSPRFHRRPKHPSVSHSASSKAYANVLSGF